MGTLGWVYLWISNQQDMKEILFIISLAVIILACKKKQFDDPNNYSDDFEAYQNIDEIIDGKNEQWSFFQNTIDGNSVEIDTTFTHSGNKSVKCIAAAKNGSDITSKASINKQFMAFWEKETVNIDFWIYIPGNNDLDWLFIFDLEEKVPIGAGPGMRLAIVNNQLLVEHKYPYPNIEQSGNGIDFPRNEWVNVRMETKLSRKRKGTVKVWQNGSLILEADNWQTLPKDILFVQQGTKGMYNQIEFGATANADDDINTVYIDDVIVYTN